MSPSLQPQAPFTAIPERCVVIVNSELPPGRAGNAAAVLSLTVGQRHPQLVGAPLVDSNGVAVPGLIPIGISVLAGTPQELRELAQASTGTAIDVIRFPVEGQQTKNYAEFLDAIRQTRVADLDYVGIALVGERKPISRLVGKLPLFGQAAS